MASERSCGCLPPITACSLADLGPARRNRNVAAAADQRNQRRPLAHRPGRQRQDNNRVCLLARSGPLVARSAKYCHAGRPHRSRAARCQPIAGAASRRLHACDRSSLADAARSRGHSCRRNPRRGNGEDRISAALTGHLVISTFHAGSSAEAISRLLDMGIEPYLITSGVRAVVQQRLVRRLCSCAVNATATVAAEALGLAVASSSSRHRLRVMPAYGIPRAAGFGRNAAAAGRRAGPRRFGAPR